MNIAPVDATVTLPAAVQAQINAANALISPEPPAQDPPAQEPPVTSGVTEPPAPPAATEPPPTPELKEEKTYTLEEWQRRYAGAEGRVKSLNKQVTNLNDEVNSLRRIIARLEAQAQAPAPVATAPAPVVFEDLTEEERNDYGPDFLKVVEKTAGKLVAQVTARYEQEIADLRKNVNAVGAESKVSAEEKMYETLSNRVPNWLELNDNQTFVNWLAQPERLSGQIRQELLNTAFNRKDGPKVAAFFEEFLREHPAAAPRPAADPGQASGKTPLEAFAAPGRAKASAPVDPGPEAKPSFTPAEISQFYVDVSKGVFRGREAEKEKIEAQIFEAQTEGRIR